MEILIWLFLFILRPGLVIFTLYIKFCIWYLTLPFRIVKGLINLAFEGMHKLHHI